jgi:hypothetical protein
LQKQPKPPVLEDDSSSLSSLSDINDVPVYSNLNMLETWLADGRTQIEKYFVSRDKDKETKR